MLKTGRHKATISYYVRSIRKKKMEFFIGRKKIGEKRQIGNQELHVLML
jgi:hypothetical protein